MRHFYTFILALFVTGLGFGQIVTFDFAGLSGNELTANSNSNDTNLTGSVISRGSGLNNSGNSNRFNATGWTSSSNIENAVTQNDYMEFTITPNTGFEFNVTSIVVNIQRSGSGPREVILRSSVDSYVQNLGGSQTISDNGSVQVKTFTFSQTNNTNPVTYRFYMRAESTGGSGGFEGTGNDITVNGSVVATSTCTAPTTQASAYNTTALGTTSATLNWMSGDGDEVLVVIKEGSAVDTDPSNGTDYTGNTVFGSAPADQIGTGNFVIQSGSATTSASVTGLMEGTTYHVAVYEYNTTDTCYNLTELTGNFTTEIACPEITGLTIISSTDTTANISWTAGDGETNWEIAVQLDGTGTPASGTPTATNNPHIESGLMQSTAYEVYVRANCLTDGFSNWVGPVDFTTLATPPSNDVCISATPLAVNANCSFSTFTNANGTNSGVLPAPGCGSYSGADVWFSVVVPTSGNIDIETASGGITDGAMALYSGTCGSLSLISCDDDTNGTMPVISATGLLPTSTVYILFWAFGGDEEGTFDICVTEPSCAIDDSGLANIMCNNNGTTADSADDITSFELNPTGAVLGASYSVDMDGFANISTSISGPFTNDVVSGISYGSATTFYLEPGSAGIGGDLDALITDVDDNSCTITATITDPDSCSFPPSLFFEDFDDGNFTANPIWTGSTGGFSVITNTTIPNGNANTDGSYLASDASEGDISLAVESTETSEWRFSLASPNFNPSSGNNFGVVLMANTSFTGSLSAANFQGYYIKIGTNGSTDRLELWRKTGTGESKVGDFPSSPNFGSGALDDGLNIRVTRSAIGEFELFYATGFEYTSTPTTSAGILTNNVYNTSTHFGVFQEFSSTSASRRVYFDNLDLLTPVTYVYDGTTWSPSDPNGSSLSTEAIIIEAGDVSISQNTDINTVVVNPGASLMIDSGITLNIDDAVDGLTLESTSSNYASLIRNGTINGTINYERFVNQIGSGATSGNDLVSVPLTSFDLNFQEFLDFGNPTNRAILATNGSNTLHAFGPYDNSNLQYINYQTFLPTTPPDPDAPELISGKGYRAASITGANVTYTGNALSTDVSIEITTPTATLNSQWNLIGNPYPSYLDAGKFLTENSVPMEDLAEAIYAYNSGTYTGGAATTGNAGNYTIINAATIAMFTGENFNIAPGQGFFVPADIATNFSGMVTFKTGPTALDDMRTTSGGDDYIVGRSTTEAYALKLGLTSNTEATTSFFFMDNASRGLDSGYDAAAFGANTQIYSHLVEDNTGRAMALQAMALNDLEDVIVPLGVNANQGELVTFSISQSDLPSTVDVYLEDNITNTVTLLNTSDYIIIPNTNITGTGRFFLRFTNSTLSNPDASTLESVNIFTNHTNKTIVIAGQVLENTKALVYDLQGRLISTTKLDTSKRSQSIDVNHLSTGVYIVQLNSASQNISQKVIIR